MYLVNELKDWQTKGAILCMNATIDPDLIKTVQQDVSALKNDIDKMAFEEEVNRENVKKALHDSQLVLEQLRERVAMVEHEQEVIKQDQSSLCEKVNTTQEQISELKSEQEDVQQRVAYLGEHLGKQVAVAEREQEITKQEQEVIKQEQEVIKQDQSSLCDKVSSTQDQISDVQRRVTYLEDQQTQINYEIANCESDIAFLAAQHDHTDDMLMMIMILLMSPLSINVFKEWNSPGLLNL
ncbi:girdin-like [Orbicella faveolata]|uniref:girdin-like n=1 Tax=Orbicella faveolata TaxID=48498 RepID=UPI0009E3111A|nr:girdin-like [Orbicella faveolata]